MVFFCGIFFSPSGGASLHPLSVSASILDVMRVDSTMGHHTALRFTANTRGTREGRVQRIRKCVSDRVGF